MHGSMEQCVLNLKPFIWSSPLVQILKTTMMTATNAPLKFCEYGWGLSAVEFHYSMIICSAGLFFGKFFSVIIMRFSISA